MAVLPDSRRIVTVDENGLHVLWDLDTNKMVRKFSFPDVTYVNQVVFSEDGALALSGVSIGQEFILWDVETGKSLAKFKAKNSSLTSYALSADATIVAVGTGDGTIELWNSDTSELLGILKGHQKEVTSIRFIDSDRQLISTTHDGTVQVWSVANGLLLHTIDTGTSNSVMFSQIAISPDGKFIVTSNRGEPFDAWDISTGEQIKLQAANMEDRNHGLHWTQARVLMHPDGRQVLLITDNEIEFKDLLTGELLRTVKSSNLFENVEAAFAVSDDGKWLATAFSRGNNVSKALHLWDLESGERVRSLSIGVAYRPRFLANGKYLAAIDSGNTIKVFDIATGSTVFTIPTRFTEDIRRFYLNSHEWSSRAFEFSPDLQRVLVWDSKEVLIYQAATGQFQGAIADLGPFVKDAVIAPDSRLALLRDAQGVKLADITTGQIVRRVDLSPGRWRGSDAVYEAKFTSDARRVIIRDFDDFTVFELGDGQHRLNV